MTVNLSIPPHSRPLSNTDIEKPTSGTDQTTPLVAASDHLLLAPLCSWIALPAHQLHASVQWQTAEKKNDLSCYLSSFCQFLQLNLAMCSLSPGHQISQYLATTSPGYPWFPSRLPENTVRKPCLASALSLDPWSGTLTGCRLIVMQGGPWKPSCIFW